MGDRGEKKHPAEEPSQGPRKRRARRGGKGGRNNRNNEDDKTRVAEQHEKKPDVGGEKSSQSTRKNNNRRRNNNRKKAKPGNKEVKNEDVEMRDNANDEKTEDNSAAEAKASRSDVFTDQKFSSLDVSAPTKAALVEFGFPSMTRIQSLSIAPGLQGKDVLIQAKTGHGKTLAFGIPLFEHIHNHEGDQGLVVAPTRELALQTKQVFEKLAQAHKLKLSCFIGGTNQSVETKWLKRNKLDVLIATPGRLLDHLQTMPGILDQLGFLILDEADRLLDEGFQREMERIFQCLPRDRDRQTILASATYPKNMSKFGNLVNLKSDHVKVSAVSKDDDNMNSLLDERVCTVTMENWMPVLYHMLMGNLSKGLKTILFMQAAQETRLIAFLLGHTPHKSKIFEIHSRLSQPQRVRQLDGFKKQKGGSILCSSDVGARGWDINNVHSVIQLGIPSDNDTYVHRVGRTARAGSNGQATCLVYSWEEAFFFKRFPRARKLVQQNIVEGIKDHHLDIQAMVDKASKNKDFDKVTQQGYQALLGYQGSSRGKMKLSAEQLVAILNDWIAVCGCSEPPALQKKTVGKMNLRGTKGLRVQGVGGVPFND